MKKCSSCGHVSVDDDPYCPNDGSILVDDNSASAFDTPTQFVPTPTRVANVPARTGSPVMYIAIGAMAATIIALGAVLYASRSTADANSSNNQTQGNGAVAGGGEATTDAPAKPLVERVSAPTAPRTSPTGAPELPNYAPGEGVNDPPASGTWFVVLGSYARHEAHKADERLRFVQGRGINATKVDTDAYPGFRKGYVSVVVGPVSKSEAQRMIPGMKSVVADAYVRSGW